jgi:hypothetical protein
MILGFSNFLRAATPYYYVDLPSFQRDFAALKTLDHGTGPNITFTRASNATFFDADGVLQTASNNVPRFDHDPATGGSSLGLLIEEARTNSIRNSQAGGSTNGVIGSGGVMPLHWGANGLVNNVAGEVVGTGTEDGLSYIDIKISGTPSASSSVTLRLETATQVVAANAQTWTNSAYIKLQSGSFTNATYGLSVAGRQSDGSSIAGQTTDNTTLPTSAALRTQRRSATQTMSSASVERVFPYLFIGYTNGSQIGGSVDGLTLRIAAPQLEQGAFPTSYIPTTTAAATRSADSAVVTPISSFYNQSEGTLFAEASPRSLTDQPNVSRVVVSLNSNNSNNQLNIQQRGNGLDLMEFAPYIFPDLNHPQAMNGGSLLTTVTQRTAGAYRVNDFAAAFNGGSPVTRSSGSVPSGITHLHIGRRPDAGTGALSGHIRKIAYWPRRLSNTLLQQLTT